MMSQNRQGAKGRIDVAHDYEVNLKAELEIGTLHEKIDMLREAQWSELVQLQRDQVRMLNDVLTRVGQPEQRNG